MLSITKHSETLIRQTHTRSQETLEFKLTQPRENFLFQQPIHFEGSCMIGLTILELWKSNFKKTDENGKFELYTDLVNEFLFTKLQDDLQEFFDISNNSPELLQNKTKRPRTDRTYKKLESERRRTDGYTMLLMG